MTTTKLAQNSFINLQFISTSLCVMGMKSSISAGAKQPDIKFVTSGTCVKYFWEKFENLTGVKDLTNSMSAGNLCDKVYIKDCLVRNMGPKAAQVKHNWCKNLFKSFSSIIWCLVKIFKLPKVV